MSCTGMLCTDDCGNELPCCNRCGGNDLRLDAGSRPKGPFVHLTGKDFGCGGYDCATHCFPFGNRPGRAYRFVGAYTLNPGTQVATFRVRQVCHAPPEVTAALLRR